MVPFASNEVKDSNTKHGPGRPKKMAKAKAKAATAPAATTPMSVPSTPGSAGPGARATAKLSVGGPPKTGSGGKAQSDPSVKMEKYEKVACFHRVLQNGVSKHDLYQAKRFKENLEKTGNHSLAAQLEARLRVCSAAMMLTPTEVAKLPWEQVEVPWFSRASFCF